MSFSSQLRQLLVLRHEGMRVRADDLCQVAVGQSFLRSRDEVNDGLLQGTVLGEVHPAVMPQSFLVELSNSRKRVVAAVHVVAGVRLPFSESSPRSGGRTAERIGELADCHDL